MNKKVDEEFSGIKDVYVLKCICTELNETRKKAIKYMKKNVEILIFEDGTEIYQVKNGNKFYEELLDILEKNNASTN